MSSSCKVPEERAASPFTLPDGMPYTLTMSETSKILHLGINSCYEAARRSEIPTLRIGRRLVVPTLALMRMLDGGNPTASTAEAGECREAL
jgi:hypothetical protein